MRCFKCNNIKHSVCTLLGGIASKVSSRFCLSSSSDFLSVEQIKKKKFFVNKNKMYYMFSHLLKLSEYSFQLAGVKTGSQTSARKYLTMPQSWSTVKPSILRMPSFPCDSVLFTSSLTTFRRSLST